MGFSPPPDPEEEDGWITDPFAFLYSLTNSLGRPEKLESKGMRKDLYYHPAWSATFGYDLRVCDNADKATDSWTDTGGTYAVSASTGTHPMARGYQRGWLAAEAVAWVV